VIEIVIAAWSAKLAGDVAGLIEAVGSRAVERHLVAAE
jgi:hypothetical protein